MPQLLVLATHSGIVTNAIVCDNESYAELFRDHFVRYTALQCKLLPMTKEVEAQFLPYISLRDIRAIYQD